MVVQRSVVQMVLERGQDRHDVVVMGLKEIALSGKVSFVGNRGQGEVCERVDLFESILVFVPCLGQGRQRRRQMYGS
jgi:hypothetical protein